MGVIPNFDPKFRPSQAELENVDGELHVSPDDTGGAGAVRTTEEVRQGHTGDHVRYVLLISAIGACIGLIGVYLLFAA